jgi:predicted Zn-dependent peptidase
MSRPIRTVRLVAVTLFASTIAACGGGEGAAPPAARPIATPSSSATPAPPTTAAREKAPDSLQAKESPFPAVKRSTLPNGLQVAVVEAHALPIVQLRVVVRAGAGYGVPGAADITAQLLKDGGTKTMTSAELLRRIETLGASLGIDVGEDATILSMGVVKGHVDEALGLLGELIREPRFDAGELTKLKERQTDEARDNARGNGHWMATRVTFRELYAPTNPYSVYGLLPSEIAKITGATVRDFHRRFYVPKNVELIVAGDVDVAAVAKATDQVFGAWKGAEPPKVDFPAAIAPTTRRVLVVNRAKSAQSDVFVTGLIPPRKTPEWPNVRVAIQVVGGGATGRLFLDLREQRSLAYAASASIVELAHGEQPLMAYAGTQTPKTVQAVQGLLENIEKAAKEPLAQGETEVARRFLSDVFAVRMETIGSIADLVATQSKLGLPDGYWDTYRAAVKQVDAAHASGAAAKMLHADHALIVVAGDADAIAPSLTRFGDVTIVDPEREFQTIKTLPKDDAAKPAVEAPK